MAARQTPWTAEIVALLATAPDGLHRETLVIEAGRLIPPGQAWRKYVTRRDTAAARRGRPKSAPPKPGDSFAIHMGRRAIMTDALNALEKRGVTETVVGQRPVIRLRSCPTCLRPFGAT